MRRTLTALGTALALATAAPVHAAIISGIYTVEADFSSGPFDPFIASFSVTFDDATGNTGTATAVTLPAGFDPGPLQYNYSARFDTLTIFGSVDGTRSQFSTGDFALTIFGVPAAPSLFSFVYMSDADAVLRVAGSSQGTAGFTPATAVPEPTSLALLGVGFLGLAGVARNKRLGSGANRP